MKKISFSVNAYKKRTERLEKTSDEIVYKKRRLTSGVGVTDSKTIIYLCNKYISQEYGRRGAQAAIAKDYKNGVLYINVESALWAQELWMQRDVVIVYINDLCGTQVVRKLVAQVS